MGTYSLASPHPFLRMLVSGQRSNPSFGNVGLRLIDDELYLLRISLLSNLWERERIGMSERTNTDEEVERDYCLPPWPS